MMRRHYGYCSGWSWARKKGSNRKKHRKMEQYQLSPYEAYLIYLDPCLCDTLVKTVSEFRHYWIHLLPVVMANKKDLKLALELMNTDDL